MLNILDIFNYKQMKVTLRLTYEGSHVGNLFIEAEAFPDFSVVA